MGGLELRNHPVQLSYGVHNLTRDQPQGVAGGNDVADSHGVSVAAGNDVDVSRGVIGVATIGLPEPWASRTVVIRLVLSRMKMHMYVVVIVADVKMAMYASRSGSRTNGMPVIPDGCKSCAIPLRAIPIGADGHV